MAEQKYGPADPEHEALAASLPQEWADAARGRYSMHGSGLVRNLLAGAVPLIVAAERERAASAVEEFARTAPPRWGTYRPDSTTGVVLGRLDRALAALAGEIRQPQERSDEKGPTP